MFLFRLQPRILAQKNFVCKRIFYIHKNKLFKKYCAILFATSSNILTWLLLAKKLFLGDWISKSLDIILCLVRCFDLNSSLFSMVLEMFKRYSVLYPVKTLISFSTKSVLMQEKKIKVNFNKNNIKKNYYKGTLRIHVKN